MPRPSLFQYMFKKKIPASYRNAELFIFILLFSLFGVKVKKLAGWNKRSEEKPKYSYQETGVKSDED